MDTAYKMCPLTIINCFMVSLKYYISPVLIIIVDQLALLKNDYGKFMPGGLPCLRHYLVTITTFGGHDTENSKASDLGNRLTHYTFEINDNTIYLLETK